MRVAAAGMAIVLGWFLVAGSETATEASAASMQQTPVFCRGPYKGKGPTLNILHELLSSHERWLVNRADHNGRRADLCLADLRGASFLGANLERIHLQGAVLFVT